MGGDVCLRRRKFLSSLSLAALLFIFGVGAVSAQTNVSSCQTINASGVYELNTSIIDSGATSCINITSSDVVFDGQGYTIGGIDTGGTYGVYVSNSTTALTNVTVKNAIITDWDRGIFYRNAQNGSIENNTASSNGYGIRLFSSSSNTLSNNNANSNGFGIYLDSSSSNTLTSNTVNSNVGSGIYLFSSSNYNTI